MIGLETNLCFACERALPPGAIVSALRSVEVAVSTRATVTPVDACNETLNDLLLDLALSLAAGAQRPA